MLDTQRPEHVPLGLRPGRREHLRAIAPGHLEGGQPDAAGGGVDEHLFPRTEAREVLEPVDRGQEGDGDGRRLLVGQRLRPRGHQV